MMDIMLQKIKRLDAAEDIFGGDFIESVSYLECDDGYYVQVKDYPGFIAAYEDNLTDNYSKLIVYLTEMKNQYENGSEPHDETDYYHDWLRFKEAYNTRKAMIYHHVEFFGDEVALERALSIALGVANHDMIVHDFEIPQNDWNRKAWNILHYLGDIFAIRDLGTKYLKERQDDRTPFQLCYMIPYQLVLEYGELSALGDELNEMKHCPYESIAPSSNLERLYNTVAANNIFVSEPPADEETNMTGSLESEEIG